MTLLAFLGIIIGAPYSIVLLKGLLFAPKDPDCKQEIKDVETNILMIKVVAIIQTLLFVAITIMSSINESIVQ